MEQRKVMSLGRSSLVISLPKHWVNLNKLKRGDVVSLEVQRDRSLTVFAGAERKKEERNSMVIPALDLPREKYFLPHSKRRFVV